MNDDDFPIQDEFKVGTLYRVTFVDNTVRDGFYDGTRLFSFLSFYDIETDTMFHVNIDSIKTLERLDDGDDSDDSDNEIEPDPEPGGGEAKPIPVIHVPPLTQPVMNVSVGISA